MPSFPAQFLSRITRPDEQIPIFSQKHLILFFCFLILGLGLRAAAFRWNNRIQGDINLFALTAREFIVNDRLYYPMKYEFSRDFEYMALANPATQHPPLWALLAGIAGKIFGTDNTFFILKVLAECTGILLLAAVFLWGCRHFKDFSIIALAFLLLCVSPTVVDFSANGSPFILLAGFLFLASWLLNVFEFQRISSYICAAIISALAYQTHGTLACLGGMFVMLGIVNIRRLRWEGVAVFVITCLILVTPFFLWNCSHFGKPLYSSAITSLYGTFGIPRTKHVGDTIMLTWSANILDMPHYLQTYATNALKSLKNLLYYGFREIGPFALVLMIVGGVNLRRKNPSLLLALLLPSTLYVLVVCAWAIFNYRFLVPVLPVTYLLASFGFVALMERPHALARGAAQLLGIGLLVWMIAGYAEHPRTRYYPNDMRHAFLYSRMVPIAMALEQQPKGVVLGIAASLDGGIEAIYWHRLPFVFAGAGWLRNDERAIKKLAADFDIRYVWADYKTVDLAQAYFPESKVIIGNESFAVLDLKHADNHCG